MAEENGKSNGNEVSQTAKAAANTAKGAAKAGKAIGGALKGVAGGPAGMIAGAVSSGGIKYGVIGCILMIVIPIVIGVCILACLGSLICGLLFGTSFDDVEPDVEDPKGEYDEYVEKLSKVFEESYAETIRGASIAISDHAVDKSSQQYINVTGNDSASPSIDYIGTYENAETWMYIHDNLLSYDSYPQKYDSELAYWYDDGWTSITLIDENSDGTFEQTEDELSYDVEWTNDMAFVIAAYSITQPYDSEDTARKNNDSSVDSTKMMKKLKKVDYFPSDYDNPELADSTYSWFHWTAGTQYNAPGSGRGKDDKGFISYYETLDNGVKEATEYKTETGGTIFYPQISKVTINSHSATITIGEFDKMAVLTAFGIDPYARYIYPNQDAVVDWEEVLTEEGKALKALMDDYDNKLQPNRPDNLEWEKHYNFSDDDIVALLIQYHDIEKFVDMPDYAGSESDLKEYLEDEAEKRGLEINYTGNTSYDYNSCFQNLQLNNSGLEKIYKVQDKYSELANAVKIAGTDEDGSTIYEKNIWPSSWARNKSLIDDLKLCWSDFDFSNYDIYYLFKYAYDDSWGIIENALNQYCPWAEEIKPWSSALDSCCGSVGLKTYINKLGKPLSNDSDALGEMEETVKVAETTALADSEEVIGDAHADPQYYSMTNLEKIEQDAEGIANTIAADEGEKAEGLNNTVAKDEEEKKENEENNDENENEEDRTKYHVEIYYNGSSSVESVEGNSAYISSGNATSYDNADELRAQLADYAVDIAENWSTHYQRGGRGNTMADGYTPNYSFPIFDCSGLTQYVYLNALIDYGISINFDVPGGAWDVGSQLEYSKADGIENNLDLLKPGDLIFFATEGQTVKATHVGMYIGSYHGSYGNFSHAYVQSSSDYNKVIVSSYDNDWNRSGRPVIAVKRVIGD